MKERNKTQWASPAGNGSREAHKPMKIQKYDKLKKPIPSFHKG